MLCNLGVIERVPIPPPSIGSWPNDFVGHGPYVGPKDGGINGVVNQVNGGNMHASFFGDIGNGFSELGDLYADLFRDLDGDFGLLNLAAAETGIFAAAATIAAEGSRPLYTSAEAWASMTNAAKNFGTKLGIFGLGLVAIDIGAKGLNTSNGLDATFGVIGLIGPIGAAVSGVYFVGNLLTVGITGRSIGEHADDYLWVPNPSGLGVFPVAKIR